MNRKNVYVEQRPRGENDGGDLGHRGQMFETYNKERKLVPVR